MRSVGNHLVPKEMVIAVAGIIAFGFAHTVLFAAINVENRTGSITITAPDGEVTTVEASEPLPAIPSGSTIEVVTGQADISVSEDDAVDVLMNNSTVVVRGGTQIAVRVNPASGAATMDVLTGSVDVLQPDGTTQTVGPGAAYVAPPPAPIAVEKLDIPGVDAAGNVGRQSDTEKGLVGGY